MFHPRSTSQRIKESYCAVPKSTKRVPLVKTQESLTSTKVVPKETKNSHEVSPNKVGKNQIPQKNSNTQVMKTARNPSIPRPNVVLGPNSEDVHFFDGKMSEMIKIVEGDLERASNIPNNVKLEAFNELEEKLLTKKNYGSVERNCYDAIVNSFMGKDSNNKDDKNCLEASSLLYLLYEEIVVKDSDDHLEILISQLKDMNTGLCPQGRTTRLLQILLMLRDDLTPTSKSL